jgi:sentrin-specific protease 8
MDDKLLSYGDCLLRVRDVALLTGPHWLNDAVMSFFFEYLRSEGAQPDEPHADRVVLVDASLSFLVANVSPNEARAVLAPLGVSRAHMALFLVRRARPRFERFSTSFDVNVRNLSDLRPTRDPGPGTRFRSAQVNDNDDVSVAGGGSHWSLLAYLRDENAFAHFDSAGGRNDAAAARLAKTLADALMDEKKIPRGDVRLRAERRAAADQRIRLRRLRAGHRARGEETGGARRRGRRDREPARGVRRARSHAERRRRVPRRTSPHHPRVGGGDE